MNDEKGPVHYQVSITGAQAGWFFLALLVALGLAFFFGMKTGAAAKRVSDSPTARLAAVSDIPVPTVPPGTGDEDPKVTTSRPPDAEPTLGIEEKPEPRNERPSKPEEPAAARAVTAPAEVPVKPVVKTAPTSPAPRPTEAPAAAGSWYVQVAALQNAAKADETVRHLRDKGYASDVSVVPDKPGLIRVRVGPYGSRAEAEAAAEKIQASEKLKNRPSVVAGP